MLFTKNPIIAIENAIGYYFKTVIKASDLLFK